MRRWGVVVASVVIAVLAGLVAGVVAAGATNTDERREQLYGDPGDRVRTAVEALLDDPVHVTPDGRELLAADDAAEISETIRERDLPVYVVVWEPSRDAGYRNPIEAADQITWGLAQATGEPAAVVMWGADIDGRLATTPNWIWRPDVDYDQREPEFLGEAAPRLTEWLGGLPDGRGSLVELDDDLPVAGGVVLGLLIGLGVLAALWALLGLLSLVLRRRAG